MRARPNIPMSTARAELKAAIAAKFARDNGLSYEPSQISVNVGGKHTLFNALVATVEAGRRGDRARALLGLLSRHRAILRRHAGDRRRRARRRATRSRPSSSMRRSRPATKWLILNSPSNPTGAAYTEAELKRAGRGAAAPPARVGDGGRYVRTYHLRRFRLRDDRAGRARALRAHADGERLLEGLFDDRLAHRLRRRPGAAHQGDVEAAVAVDLQPLLDRAGGGGGGAQRGRRISSSSAMRRSSGGAIWSAGC